MVIRVSHVPTGLGSNKVTVLSLMVYEVLPVAVSVSLYAHTRNTYSASLPGHGHNEPMYPWNRD